MPMKRFGSLVVLATALFAGLAQAGGRLPCSEVRVFDRAAVNVLVLPYRYAGNEYGDLRSTGSRLSALVQQEALLSMLKFGSVGATELVLSDSGGRPSPDNDPCDVREVLRKVMRDGQGTVRPGHGLIVMWGRIYESGGDIYVQSYLRFVRRDRPEAIDVLLRGPGASSLATRADLPAQAVAFPPRRTTAADIEEIEARARSSLLLRDRPSADAKGSPLAPDPHEPLTYGVLDSSDGWLKVRSWVTQKEGWIQARTDSAAWSLRRFLPELYYLEGLAGYLRLRTGEAVPNATGADDLLAAARSAFDQYDRAVGPDTAPEARSLARALLGFALWTTPDLGPEPGRRKSAAELFNEGRTIAPESAPTRVLAAVTSPFMTAAPAADRKAMAKIESGLLGAAALDPKYEPSLRNLTRLYEFAEAVPAESPVVADELRRRLQVTREAWQKSRAR